MAAVSIDDFYDTLLYICNNTSSRTGSILACVSSSEGRRSHRTPSWAGSCRHALPRQRASRSEPAACILLSCLHPAWRRAQASVASLAPPSMTEPRARLGGVGSISSPVPSFHLSPYANQTLANSSQTVRAPLFLCSVTMCG